MRIKHVNYVVSQMIKVLQVRQGYTHAKGKSGRQVSLLRWAVAE